MIEIVKGDLLETDLPFVCQQVNCHGVMGAGLALQIREKWPHVYAEYKKLCSGTRNRRSLLGTIQPVEPPDDKTPAVINVFGQYDYGRNGVFTDYSALDRAFREMNRRFAGRALAFPHGFGCGLAGGDWTDIEQLLLNCLPDCKVRVYMKG